MPSPGEDVQAWSVTAADNGSADPLINWVEGQTRASVNNSSRSELAAHAKNRNLLNGSIVTTGSANAQAFLSGVNYTAVPSGLRATVKVGGGLTNTGSITLNMDGIGAVLVKTADGNDCLGNEFIANSYVDLLYNGTNWIFLYSREFFFQLVTGGGGIVLAQKVYSAGAATWTPEPLMKSCIIECVGGGGGGGDAASNGGQLMTGGGGGSGGYSRKFADAATMGASQVVTVGVGGAAGINGGPGGTTSVGALCIAFGGTGGGGTLDGANTPFGGNGGAAGTGDITAAGSPGEQGGYTYGMTGASGGPFVMGGGGRGGSSYFGGGGQIPVVGLSGNAPGGAAGHYGSGGSGAISNQTGGYNGSGPGSPGLVVITEFAGVGTPGRDGAPGNPGAVGPPGPAGSGTGDVLVSGTPAAGQMAQWVDTSHIKGVPSEVMLTTGDAKLTLKTIADAGWVMMNDGTIGDASSSATTRANADCQNLFFLLWNNIPNAWAPMAGGRGASATADWNAHKPIALTRQLGRTLGIAGAGAGGLTSRALGSFVGEEAHVQTASELVSHTHGAATAFNYPIYGDVALAAAGSDFYVYRWLGGTAASQVVNVNPAGSGAAANVMQPTSFWNIMIKL